MKKKPQKLKLYKETLHQLTAGEEALRQAKGATAHVLRVSPPDTSCGTQNHPTGCG